MENLRCREASSKNVLGAPALGGVQIMYFFFYSALTSSDRSECAFPQFCLTMFHARRSIKKQTLVPYTVTFNGVGGNVKWCVDLSGYVLTCFVNVTLVCDCHSQTVSSCSYPARNE